MHNINKETIAAASIKNENPVQTSVAKYKMHPSVSLAQNCKTKVLS